jgi:hypothetical protein
VNIDAICSYARVHLRPFGQYGCFDIFPYIAHEIGGRIDGDQSDAAALLLHRIAPKLLSAHTAHHQRDAVRRKREKETIIPGTPITPLLYVNIVCLSVLLQVLRHQYFLRW